jgi:hypothetical protein
MATVVVTALMVSVSAGAQAKAGGHSASDLSKASQNPVGDLASVPFQFNFFSGGDLGDESLYNLNVQPVFPLPIGKKWTIIARSIVPYFSTPILGVARESGLGDIQQQFFLTPAKPGRLIWGAGPMFSFPTATNDVVRSGAWGLGPTVVALMTSGPWLGGVLVTQLWTIAAYENDIPNINVMTAQPFINYNMADGWAITFAPIIVGNWALGDDDDDPDDDDDDEEWTVPLGLGFSKVTALGRQPISIGIQYYYNVVRPFGAGSNQIKLIASFLYPVAHPEK